MFLVGSAVFLCCFVGGSGIASHSATALLSADFSPDVPVKAAGMRASQS